VTQWLSSRVSTFLTGSHLKLRPNTEGTKRFVIAAGEYHKEAQVFPALHPNGRQSQHKIATGSPQDVASIFRGRSHVQHTTLLPGQILFLPGFTFHMVTASPPTIEDGYHSLAHSNRTHTPRELSVGISTMSKSDFNQGANRMVRCAFFRQKSTPAVLVPRLLG
jgi:hypothetical protein